ncbi:MAG: outer membrane beta-barrel protein [Rhodopila sp.]|nr:outer membrane beta-barrel protein [Rhodopila sp.]
MLRMALLATALLLPAIATAQPARGFYVDVGAGANIANDLLSSNETTKVSTDLGPVGLVGLGWRYGNGLRTEIEGSYRTNDVSGIATRRVNGALLPLGNAGGSARTYAIMANIAYDIPFQPFGLPLQPYVGAGVGYGWLDFNNANGDGYGTFALPQGNSYTGPTVVSFGSAGAFAYQAIVGASLPLRILPGLEATLEYRFFGMARADVPVDRMAANQTNLINGAVPSFATHNGFEVHDNAILIGLRYTFGGR